MRFVLRRKHPALGRKKASFSFVRPPAECTEIIILTNELKANWAVYRYWKLKGMHLNEAHSSFCLASWISTNALVATGGPKKDPNSGRRAFGSLKEESLTPEKLAMTVLFLIPTIFWLHTLLARNIFSPVVELR